MKTLIAITLAILISSPPLWALMIEETILTGVVIKFDSDSVTIKDEKGLKHEISRSELPKDLKLAEKKKISITRKLKPEQLKISNLPLRLPPLKKAKLDKEGLKRMLLTYMIFIKSIDDEAIKRGDYKKSLLIDEKLQSSFFLNFFLDSLHASPEAPDFRCFWGGWPTHGTTSSGSCNPPYTAAGRGSLAEDDPLRYNSCGGGNNVYRCNPVLFGPARNFLEEGSTAVLGTPTGAIGAPNTMVYPIPQADASKGICVQASNATQVVDRCMDAAGPHLAEQIDLLQTDEAYQTAFDRFAESVEAFCRDGRNNSNAACGNLRTRIAQLNLGRQENVAEEMAEGTSCEYLEHDTFGMTIGTPEGQCPGSLCFLRARCAFEGDSEAPAEVYSVCGCSNLPPDGGGNPTAGQMLNCMNDQSIAVLNPSNRPRSEEGSGSTEVLPQ